MFGEIDCREGLLLALERDRYASIEEGMEHTIGIFCTVLTKLIRKRRFKVFIIITILLSSSITLFIIMIIIFYYLQFVIILRF